AGGRDGDRRRGRRRAPAARRPAAGGGRERLTSPRGLPFRAITPPETGEALPWPRNAARRGKKIRPGDYLPTFHGPGRRMYSTCHHPRPAWIRGRTTEACANVGDSPPWRT